MKTIALGDAIPQKGDVLLYIATTWCKYCLKTKPAIDRAEKARPDLVALMIDGDEDPDVLDTYGAKTYPTLILHRDGVETAHRQSADNEELAAWLDEHLA